jgi:phosphoesterase RecJ-like protein
LQIYNDILELIDKSRYIVIITHKNPDPDTLGCAIAMSNFLTKIKKKHKIFSTEKEPLRNMDFLNGYNKISSSLPKYYDLAISFDCATKERFGTLIDSKIINIDHHHSNTLYGDINLVDYSKSSTAEILFDMLLEVNGLSKDVAQALFVAIYDDTQGFTSKRCSKKSFDAVSKLLDYGINIDQITQKFFQRDSLAKYRLLPKVYDSLTLYDEGKIAVIYQKNEWLSQTGGNWNDIRYVINDILKISVVDVALLFREKNNTIRVSIKSKNSNILNIAKEFGGGGHHFSAGFIMENKTLDEAIKEVISKIKDKNGSR